MVEKHVLNNCFIRKGYGCVITDTNCSFCSLLCVLFLYLTIYCLDDTREKLFDSTSF